MNKVIASLVLLLATVSFTPPAFAVSYDPNFYTSNAESGSFVDKFNADQDIWLYINLPASGLSFTSYWTTDPDSTSWLSYTAPTMEQSSWYKLNDLSFIAADSSEYSWDEVVKTGLWTISGTYSYPAGTSGNLQTNFTINAVPEPLSAGLFLIGGAGLAVIRRKKA